MPPRSDSWIRPCDVCCRIADARQLVIFPLDEEHSTATGSDQNPDRPTEEVVTLPKTIG